MLVGWIPYQMEKFVSMIFFLSWPRHNQLHRTYNVLPFRYINDYWHTVTNTRQIPVGLAIKTSIHAHGKGERGDLQSE